MPSGSEAPPSQKRPHRKSRNGCLQCKRKKIKCDEQKPACGHCRRYQDNCTFPDISNSSLSPSTLTHPSGLSPLPSFHTIDLASATPRNTIDVEVPNLELLHFYTTHTAFTLSYRPSHQHIWQETVPAIAFQHPFLLHGILAFSALHLARSHPERKVQLYTEATAHHDVGLMMFRTAMSEITRDNCDACFAFSALIAAYAWASSDQTGDLFFSDPSKESTVEWVSLLRGVHTLLKAAGEWMAQGPMKEILQARHIDPRLTRALDPEISAKLTSLSQLWDLTTGKFSIEDTEALDLTLAVLHESWGLVTSSAIDSEMDDILVVYAWPVHVPQTFLDMLKEERPEALVLLAHYSLLLNRVDQLWYMQGMGKRLLETVRGKIGGEWGGWIAWLE